MEFLCGAGPQRNSHTPALEGMSGNEVADDLKGKEQEQQGVERGKGLQTTQRQNIFSVNMRHSPTQKDES